MKKIANILTFHYVTNYGAVLQAFALSNVLKKYYNEVQILNYRSEYINKGEKGINFYSIKSIIDSLYSFYSFKSRIKNFEKFRSDYVIETKLYETNDKVENLENTDLYIGSDQIWNLDITNNDESYFGNFKSTQPQNVFSYAASLGVSIIDKEKEKKIKEYIKSVDFISMREETGAKVLKETTDKRIEVVLDPTLLLTKKEWKEKLNLKDKNEKYIFLYSLTANPTTINTAQEISKKLNIPIIEVSGLRKSLKRRPKHKVLYDANPKDFVELLANAEFVVTDSFHATSFSIIFEKEFITTVHKTRGSRIVDLLTKLDIIERYTNDVDENICNKKIDYKSVKDKLKKYKNSSIDFIERCVKYNEKNSKQ